MNNNSNNGSSSQSFSGSDDFKIIPTPTTSTSTEEYYSDVKSSQQHPPSPLPRKKPNPLPRTTDPASRLDALCRSTLERPDDPNHSLDSQNSTLSTPGLQVSRNSTSGPSPMMNGQHGVESRRFTSTSQDPGNYMNGPKVMGSNLEIVTRSTPSLANGLVSPRIDSTDDSSSSPYVYQRIPGNSPKPKTADSNFTDNSRQFNGHHLKSRSGGDDYLYTDYMRPSVLNHRPCIRSNRIRKSNSSSMKRSNSFHQRQQVASSNTSGDSTYSQPAPIRTEQESYRSSPMLDQTPLLAVIPSESLERSRKRLSYGSSYSVPDVATPTQHSIDVNQQVCKLFCSIILLNLVGVPVLMEAGGTFGVSHHLMTFHTEIEFQAFGNLVNIPIPLHCFVFMAAEEWVTDSS